MVEHASGSHSPEGYSGDDGVRIRDRSARLAARLRRTGAGDGTGVDPGSERPDVAAAPNAASTGRSGPATGAAAAGPDSGTVATGAWPGPVTGAWENPVDAEDAEAEAATAALADVSRVGGSALLASAPQPVGARGSASELLNAPRRPLSFYVAPFGTPPFGNPPGATPPWPGSDRAVRARPVWGPPQRGV